MKKIIAIVGPTASGKTKLSIELAKKFNSEIVSADSMQIYKYMDIGTAKPTTEEMQGIKHYLIDEINPDQEFSVAQYRNLAAKCIRDIYNKGKIPIIVGGTGLYINSLIYNIEFCENVVDREFRTQLKLQSETEGNEALYNRLKEVDPLYAHKIHINDTKRIIRALEVFKFTKKPMSYHIEKSKVNSSEFQFIIIGLRMERQTLYERINRRVDIMVKNGLVNEVEKLIEMGVSRSSSAMQAIGYKEILSYLNKEINFEDVISMIKQSSRRYAKRQITWFKRIENVNWIDIDKKTFKEILDQAIKLIELNGIFL